jgi:hypothetical protein
VSARTRTGRRVVLSRHALDRLEQRTTISVARAAAEVAAALDHGRTSIRQPAWCPSPNGGRGRAQNRLPGTGGTRRYAWNAEQTRAYLVDLSNRNHAHVVTILARQEEEAA